MNIFKFVDVKIFLISLAIGLFVVYITKPNSKIIYVYPNPSNLDKIHYKDKADNCFTFDSVEVSCPNDENLIERYNIQ